MDVIFYKLTTSQKCWKCLALFYDATLMVEQKHHFGGFLKSDDFGGTIDSARCQQYPANISDLCEEIGHWVLYLISQCKAQSPSMHCESWGLFSHACTVRSNSNTEDVPLVTLLHRWLMGCCLAGEDQITPFCSSLPEPRDTCMQVQVNRNQPACISCWHTAMISGLLLFYPLCRQEKGKGIGRFKQNF